QRIGAEIVSGDLSDAAALRRVWEGVDVVYHAAARVGDWGPWSDFVRVSIDCTRNLLESAAQQKVHRFLHISSVSVYGHVDGDGNNRLNVVHAANVAEGAILAANCERCIGEAYNASHDGVLTQRQYFDAVADAVGAPRVTKSVPYGIAYQAAFLMECYGHLLRT